MPELQSHEGAASSTSGFTPSRFDTLGEEICRLGIRIAKERQIWADHLARSRLQRPQERPRGNRLRNAYNIRKQLRALHRQMTAYNARARATRVRGTNERELTMAHLVEADDAQPVSTEVARSVVYRLVLRATLELRIHAAALHKMEDRLSFALEMLAKLADRVMCSFQAGGMGLEERLSFAGNHAEGTVLMLKAMMAKLGMKIPRQRIMQEFFDAHNLDDAGGNTHAEDAEELARFDEAMGSGGDRNRDYLGLHSEIYGDEDDDTDMANSVDEHDQVQLRQTVIPEYFSPPSAGL